MLLSVVGKEQQQITSYDDFTNLAFDLLQASRLRSPGLEHILIIYADDEMRILANRVWEKIEYFHYDHYFKEIVQLCFTCRATKIFVVHDFPGNNKEPITIERFSNAMATDFKTEFEEFLLMLDIKVLEWLYFENDYFINL